MQQAEDQRRERLAREATRRQQAEATSGSFSDDKTAAASLQERMFDHEYQAQLPLLQSARKPVAYQPLRLILATESGPWCRCRRCQVVVMKLAAASSDVKFNLLRVQLGPLSTLRPYSADIQNPNQGQNAVKTSQSLSFKVVVPLSPALAAGDSFTSMSRLGKPLSLSFGSSIVGAPIIGGPRDHVNVRILKGMISGIHLAHPLTPECRIS